MLRSVLSSIGNGLLRGLRTAPLRYSHPYSVGAGVSGVHSNHTGVLPGIPHSTANLSSFSSVSKANHGILQRSALHPAASCTVIPRRTFIKMSLADGKKIPEERVLLRFYRLPWGSWIKRIAGCKKRVWKKSQRALLEKDQHWLVSRHFSQMFDRMVTREYRGEKFYVDDIYEPYMKRYNMKYPYYRPRIDRLHAKLAYPELSSSLLSARKAMDSKGDS